ncbi:hypothetical protein VNI00_014828 [Paramarasmius palmivorus]|uniref:Nephrocystin 3-like N-terminal domain-containing protein n=1 Tax=Paramarasmius palmivorus TaxID=297713 RepID=A0AAW0BRZ4_9AGAR
MNSTMVSAIFLLSSGLSLSSTPAGRQNPFDILSHSASLNATHTSEQRFPPPKCHPETREEILKTLSTWILAKNRSRIMWVYGTVGVGKSAIAQTLCEKFVTSCLAASFFFSRTDSSRNHIDCFVATISHQLATAKSFVFRYWARRAIRAAMKNDRAILRRIAIEETFRALVLGPYMAVPRIFQAYTPSVLIVDGLDECLDIPSQERLLKLWAATMSRHPCPFDLLIFSRPEPHITDFFNRISRESLAFDRLRIGDSFQTDRDIETFLLSRFHEIRVKHHRVMQNVPDPWPGPAVISQLVQRACSQFVYATTVIKYIDSPHALPTKRLDDILSARPAKPSPYAELDLLYQQILRSCHDITAVLQILQLVLGSSSDIPVNELWLIAQILEVDEAMIPVLMIGLHSVLQVPSNSRERIVIFHASFSEFLRDPERSQEFFVPPLPDDVRMKVYFILRFESLRSRGARRLPQSWPGKNALASCVQRAGGQILYADILLDYLEDDPDGRLDAVLSLQPRQMSTTAELDLLCREILRECGDVALHILQLILAPSPELPTNTTWLVAQVLDMDYNAVTGHLAKLRPIVLIPSESTGTNNPIRIRHPSISNFLQSPERAQQFYITPLSKDQKFVVYISTMITSVRTEHKLLQSWPGQSAFRSILRRSGGDHVYVDTLTRYLTVDPSQRLAKFLDWKFEEHERSPEFELYTLYRLVLDSCDDSYRIRQLLWLIRDRSSWISIALLSRALGLPIMHIPRILERLQPVCRVMHGNGEMMVSFWHPSFSDFLLDVQHAGPYAIPPSPDEKIKATLCDHLEKHELWPGTAAVNRLVQMACGQEIYVRTLIQYIGAQSNPTRALFDIVYETRITSPKSPTNPYPHLDRLYHRVLCTDSGPGDHHMLLRVLLMAIKFDEEKSALISNCIKGYLDGIDVPLLFESLRPILEFSLDPERPCPICFYHPSFPEFLLDEERSKEFYVGPGSLVNEDVERLIQAYDMAPVLP